MNSSSVRSGICRPDGAGDGVGRKFYKDFAPDGAISLAAGGAEAKRAFAAMMDMGKIDLAKIKAALRG